LAGKTYNAGTIFLQVVPVFGDTQRAIKREVDDLNKTLGDDLEKGAKTAGKRAGKALADEFSTETEEGAKKAANAFEKELKKSLKDIDSALKPIKPKFESNEVRKQLSDLRKDFAALNKEVDQGLNPKRYKEVGDQLRIMQAHAAGLQDDFSELQKHDFRKVSAGLDGVLKRMDSVRKAAELEIKTDFTPVERQMSLFEKKAKDSLKKVSGYFGDIGDEGVRNLKRRIDELGDVEIGVEMRAGAFEAELREVQAQLAALSSSGAEVDVSVASAKAEADLAVLLGAIETLDGRDIDIQADVDAGRAVAQLGMLRSLFGGTSTSSEAAANSFRSFNWVVAALAGLLPGLIPLVGALGGALVGLLPILAAVGAGLGTAIFGFSGIGDAYKALDAVDKDLAKSTEDNAKRIRTASYAVQDARQAVADAERNAAQAAEDAARAVAKAREQAADAVEEALRRQKDAQKSYRDSVEDVRQAEKDLRDARRRAKEDLEGDKDNNADRQRQNALAIREAQLAAFNATETYNAVMADGSSTTYDKEAADIAMKQAQERLHELRETQKELEKEGKELGTKKPGDDSGVQTAEERLKRAQDAQIEAQEKLKRASDEVTEARVKGAERVAEAIEAQRRSEADGARSVARAQEQLRRANEQYGEALQQTGAEGTAAYRNLQDAMDALGPAGQRFALFLYGLRAGFRDLRREVQEAFLPGVQAGMEKVIAYYGPRFTDFMTTMGGVAGNFALQLADSLTGPAWEGFFKMMDALGPKMTAQFGQTTLLWFEGFASILTTAAPWAERMSDAMLRGGEAFAAWSRGEAGVTAVQNLLTYMEKVGPSIGAFLSAFWDALVNLGKALAPWGGMVLGVLTEVLEFIAGMDTQNLGVIASAVIAMILAFQAAVGVVALVNGGMSVMMLTGSKLVFAVLGVVGVVLALGLRYEWLGDILKSIGDFILEHIETIGMIAGVVFTVMGAWKLYQGVMAAWRGIIAGYTAVMTGAATATMLQGNAAKFGGAMAKVYAAGQWLMNASLLGFPLVWILVAFAAVIAIVVLLWKKNETFRNIVLKAWDAIKVGASALWDGIKWAFDKIKGKVCGVFKYIKEIWENILWPVFKLLGKVVWKVWTTQIKVAWEAIKLLWKGLSKMIETNYNIFWKPVFNGIMDLLGGKKGLKNKFETVVGAIKKIWDGLKAAFATPIKFFIETIINKGLVRGFNKIAKFVGADEMKPMSVPGAISDNAVSLKDIKRARGGVLPGYTPGRDVHTFVSPTAGRLHLSGGEAIMRPEFTAAVGSGWIDSVNAAARKGPAAIRKMLGGGAAAYAKGGIFWPTNFRTLSPDYPGHTGVDISLPGSADYGAPVFAAHDGVARNINYGNRSYGNSVWIQGAGMQTIYGHLSKALVTALGQTVKAGQQIGNIGSTGNSTGPHLHFEVRPGGTRAAALAYLNGSYTPKGGNSVAPGAGDDTSGFPGWLMDFARGPIGWFKNRIADPTKELTEKFAGNSFVMNALKLPGKIMTDLANFAVSKLPSPLDSIGEGALKAVGKAKDVVKGVFNFVSGRTEDDGGHEPGVGGGGLPYNGTMMYDSGGYLPPGMTTVVNLTGKPEPVFTNDQFKKMGQGGQGGGFTYSPTFNDSDLTSEDVMKDLEFTLRKMRRQGAGRFGGF